MRNLFHRRIQSTRGSASYNPSEHKTHQVCFANINITFDGFRWTHRNTQCRQKLFMFHIPVNWDFPKDYYGVFTFPPAPSASQPHHSTHPNWWCGADTHTHKPRLKEPALPSHSGQWLTETSELYLQQKSHFNVWPKFNSYLDHPKVPAVRFVITKLDKRTKRECHLIYLLYKSTGKSKKSSTSFENAVNQNRSPLFGRLHWHQY